MAIVCKSAAEIERMRSSGRIVREVLDHVRALVAPGATITVAGTATAVLLLDTLTVSPPFGAALLRVTLHVSFTIPLTDALPHESEVTVGRLAVCVCAAEMEAIPAISSNAQKQRNKGESEFTDRLFSGLQARIYLRPAESAGVK